MSLLRLVCKSLAAEVGREAKAHIQEKVLLQNNDSSRSGFIESAGDPRATTVLTYVPSLQRSLTLTPFTPLVYTVSFPFSVA